MEQISVPIFKGKGNGRGIVWGILCEGCFRERKVLNFEMQRELSQELGPLDRD